MLLCRAVLLVFVTLSWGLAQTPGTSAKPSPLDLTGHWEGFVVAQGVRLGVSLDFVQTATTTSGLFTSETQRAMDYPLASVTVNGRTLHFALGDDMVFDGDLQADAITGTFKDSDQSGTFSLHRAAEKPLPYLLREVTFSNGDVKLAGTLMSPRTPGRHPAVVLLQGSGPEVRWGTNRFIADRLARAGVVALIYDKRGSGASGGDWKTADYKDLALDALSGVALLRNEASVDPYRIGLHGHSQGGIIASEVAKLSPKSIAFIVAEDTVAGPVWEQDIYRVRNALAKNFKPAEAEAAMHLYSLFIEVALGKRPYEDLASASAAASKEPWFEWLGIPPRDSWLWSWYAKTGNVNTLENWREVRSPTLLVFGERDALVPVGESIAKIEAELEKNDVPVTALIAPAAEHNLTIHPQPGEAFFWWKTAPGIVDAVVDWILQQPARVER